MIIDQPKHRRWKHPHGFDILKKLGIVERSSASFSEGEDNNTERRARYTARNMPPDDSDEEVLFDKDSLLNGERQTSIGSVRKNQYAMNCAKSLHCHMILLSVAFFVVGLCIAIVGPTLPDIQLHTKTAKFSSVVSVVSANAFGALIGLSFAGACYTMLNGYCVITFALWMCAFATLIIPWCTALTSALFVFIAQGLCLGFIEKGVFTLFKFYWKRKYGVFLCFYLAMAVGAMLSPLVTSSFVATNFGFPQHVTSFSASPSLSFKPSAAPPLLLSNVFKREVNNNDASLVVATTELSGVNNVSCLNSTDVNCTTFSDAKTFVTTLPATVKIKKPAVADASNIEPGRSRGDEKQDQLEKQKNQQAINEAGILTTTLLPTTTKVVFTTTNMSTILNTTTTPTLLLPTTTFSNATSTTLSDASSTSTETPSSSTPLPSTTTFVATTVAPVIITTTTSRVTTTYPAVATTTSVVSNNTVVIVAGTSTVTPKTPASLLNVDPMMLLLSTVTKNESESNLESNATTVDPATSSIGVGLTDSVWDYMLKRVAELNNVRVAYLVISMISLTSTLLYIFTCCCSSCRNVRPPPPLSVDSEEENHFTLNKLWTHRINLYAALVSWLFFVLTASIESVASNLLTVYCVTGLLRDQSAGALATSVYWFFVALSRLAALSCYKRLWQTNCLAVALTLSFVACGVTVVWSTNWTLLCLCVATLGFTTGHLAPLMFCWLDQQLGVAPWFVTACLCVDQLGRALATPLTTYGMLNYSPRIMPITLLIYTVFLSAVTIFMRKIVQQAGCFNAAESLTETVVATRHVKLTNGQFLEYHRHIDQIDDGLLSNEDDEN